MTIKTTAETAATTCFEFTGNQRRIYQTVFLKAHWIGSNLLVVTPTRVNYLEPTSRISEKKRGVPGVNQDDTRLTYAISYKRLSKGGVR